MLITKHFCFVLRRIRVLISIESAIIKRLSHFFHSRPPGRMVEECFKLGQHHLLPHPFLYNTNTPSILCIQLSSNTKNRRGKLKYNNTVVTQETEHRCPCQQISESSSSDRTIAFQLKAAVGARK